MIYVAPYRGFTASWNNGFPGRYYLRPGASHLGHSKIFMLMAFSCCQPEASVTRTMKW